MIVIYIKAPAGKKYCIYVFICTKLKKIYYSKVVKKSKLTEKWHKYSLELLEYGDDKFIRSASGVNGACYLDNLVIEMKE